MINYRRVAKAIKQYERIGYEYVDTPWLVSDQAIAATLPAGKHGFELGHPTLKPGKLVGSAEQGFIQLMLDEKLRPGLYCSAGPCFRDETQVDATHLYAFFKVELIKVYGRTETSYEHDVRLMAHDARAVLEHLYGPNGFCQLVKTEEGLDLEVDGVEVGSYGYREREGHRWVYGTGLALPRASQAYKVRG